MAFTNYGFSMADRYQASRWGKQKLGDIIFKMDNMHLKPDLCCLEFLANGIILLDLR